MGASVTGLAGFRLIDEAAKLCHWALVLAGDAHWGRCGVYDGM